MFLNNDIYSGIVLPQFSEISMKNNIQAFKCANAVTAYISIVFLSSKL